MTVVKCDKQQNVDHHRATKKHSSFIDCLQAQPKLVAKKESDALLFSERVTKAFLAADIPLKKLQNSNLRELFRSFKNCGCSSYVMFS